VLGTSVSQRKLFAGSTKQNSGISETCCLEMKTDMRVLFAVFYQSTETVFVKTSGEAVRYETFHNEQQL
jgi:hypothetical protein